MMAGRTLRMVVQAVYFVMLARTLGVREYGAFIGAASMAGILAPFSTLGTGFLIVRDVAGDPQSFRRAWGHALAMTALSAAVLVVLGSIVGRLVLPATISTAAIVLIAIAELGFARLLEICSQAFQAFEQLPYTAAFLFGLSFTRMVAAAALLSIEHPTALSWSIFYLAGTAAPAVVGLLLVNRRLGRPKFEVRWDFGHLREGAYFSISLAAQSVYNDIDKAMLARLSGLAASGLYGAAYRLIEVAFTPVSSVLAASFPRFMKHGNRSRQACMKFGLRLLWRAVAYGVVAWLGLFVAAPLLRTVLGSQYADAVTALRWLAPLVLLKCMHYVGADSLTGFGRQGLRSAIQTGVALLNVGLNLAILPAYGWRGAAVTSLISDGALAIGVWCAVIELSRRGQEKDRRAVLGSAAILR
jgi:O-antigen/teichoic acid export membrane protein